MICAHAEVRGQLVGVDFLLPCGSQDRTQVDSLGSKCLYCMSSLAHPMGSVNMVFVAVVVRVLQFETAFYCQSKSCVSLFIFNPQLHFFSD